MQSLATPATGVACTTNATVKPHQVTPHVIAYMQSQREPVGIQKASRLARKVCDLLEQALDTDHNPHDKSRGQDPTGYDAVANVMKEMRK